MVRPLLHAAGMFVLGSICLVAIGIAFDHRVASPLPVWVGVPAIGTAGGGTAARVQRISVMNSALRGASMTLRAAASALAEGDTSKAARLLDGGKRVAQVIAFCGATASHQQLLDEVEAARHGLQNGDPGQAAAHARAAARIADTVAPSSLPRIPATTATYAGAVVVDPTGSRVGTISDIDDVRVTVERDGLRDVLGFITLRRGQHVSLPRAAVLVGEPRALGQTLAVAAVDRDNLDSRDERGT